MIDVVSDINTVAESGSISGKSLMFEMLQAPTTQVQISIINRGANAIVYIFQQYNTGSAAWEDLGVSGTVYNTTLVAESPSNVSLFAIDADYPKVRMIASASGASTLEFSIMRYFNRGDAGSIPLVSY